MAACCRWAIFNMKIGQLWYGLAGFLRGCLTILWFLTFCYRSMASLNALLVITFFFGSLYFLWNTWNTGISTQLGGTLNYWLVITIEFPYISMLLMIRKSSLSCLWVSEVDIYLKYANKTLYAKTPFVRYEFSISRGT